LNREIEKERSKRVTLGDALKDRERCAHSVVNFNGGKTAMIGAEGKMNKRRRKKGFLKNIVQP